MKSMKITDVRPVSNLICCSFLHVPNTKSTNILATERRF